MKILFVVKYFPPYAGGGRAYRAAKLVKQLTKKGHQVTIICGNKIVDEDNSLLSGIVRERMSVISVDTPDTFFNRIVSKLLRNIAIADGDYLFSLRQYDKLLKTNLEYIPDVVISSSAPYEVHMVGRAIQHNFDIPWVADFRDPYTLNHNYKKKIPLAIWFDRWFERYVYRHANGVIFNTNQNLIDSVEKFNLKPTEDYGKLIVCQNGYDEDDVTQEIRLFDDKATYTISYIGGFRGDQYELEIVESIINNKSLYIKNNIKFRFVGNGTNLLKAYRENNEEIIELFDFCSQDELKEHWHESDAFLLMLPPSKQYLGWVPQKLYSYMAYGKPILAYVPDGEAADYLSKYRASVVVNNFDKTALEVVDQLKSYSENNVVDNRYKETFSQQNLSKRIIDLLEEVKY